MEMNSLSPNHRSAAMSLLTDAIGAKRGSTLAIIAEDPELGYYDALVPQCVAATAAKIDVNPTIIPVSNHVGVQDIPPIVRTALETDDHVLFQARLGDTLRFSSLPGKASVTMSYALDLSVLGGPACTTPHRVLNEIQSIYQDAVDHARTWRIQCPLGTDLSGEQDIQQIDAGSTKDFSVVRYPVCAPRPISCSSANGIVAVAHWLMASGNRAYADNQLLLSDVVFAEISDGRIVDYWGPARTVAQVKAHTERVGRQFGVDHTVVHSWHAGINPGASYPVEATTNLERWGMVAFANPRYLHFHVCGDYAPGEIAWSVFDASVQFDGKQLWKDGKFVFLDGEETREILTRYGIDRLPDRRDIGVPRIEPPVDMQTTKLMQV